MLVVDDNEANRRILKGILTHWRMESAEAEGGETALATSCQLRHGETSLSTLSCSTR